MQANYLDHPDDWAASTSAMQIVRRIARQPALQSVVVREVRPGPGVSSDTDVLKFVRGTGQTCWHPVGTCRMGAGADAVVDAELRVHGGVAGRGRLGDAVSRLQQHQRTRDGDWGESGGSHTSELVNRACGATGPSRRIRV